ncbi:MAG: hypothetical protein RBT76_13605 [candidate division Zixibacteria bacterium]|jgi:hypothetical protein|nr:hypothetical protein [candidate division Zixibacteria bacterium]
MKKICVALVMVAMLVCIFAPGVSARSRPMWMDQLQNRADKPQGEETGWNVDAAVVGPETTEPDHEAIQPMRHLWLDVIVRLLVPVSYPSPTESVPHETIR